MPLETVTVAVVDDEVVPQPVDGVTVRVFDTTGTTFITQAVTGAVNAGEVEFTLDGDVSPTQYSLRFSKVGYSTLSPQAIEVYSPASGSPTGTNNFRVSGSVRSLPESADNRLCRVSGYIYDGAGRPKRGIDMHFIPLFSPLIVDGRGVLGERVTVRTDKSGYLEFDLWRDGCYQAVVESHENVVREVVVPNRSSINVMHLLFPVVESVVFNVPLTVSVGGELSVTPTITGSNFQVLDGVAASDVLYATDDPAVATVTVNASTLVIRGMAAGTTNLTVTRLDQTILHVPDIGIAGSPATITVI